MNTKKILLPESTTYKERSRSRGKKRKAEEHVETMVNQNGTFVPRSSTSKCTPLVTDQRQKNEAVGLVMVGFSAFSLSLIHYITSSSIPGIINNTMVYLGIGVYIVPTLVGLMGIQKFMERPFKNLPWRIAGSIGTLIFSLGLFYTEGGKLGTWTFNTMANIFGGIPTRILFSALLMSSMIFALDILYKDVLGAVLICTSLATRFFKFCWEVSINLIAMTIGAIKTTTNACVVAYRKIRQNFSENQIDPESHLGKLLAFRPNLHKKAEDSEEPNGATSENIEGNTNTSEVNTIETVKASTDQEMVSANNAEDIQSVHKNNVINLNSKRDIEEEDATIVPVHQSLNTSNNEAASASDNNANAPISSAAPIVANVGTVQIASINSECIFVSANTFAVPTIEATPKVESHEDGASVHSNIVEIKTEEKSENNNVFEFVKPEDNEQEIEETTVDETPEKQEPVEVVASPITVEKEEEKVEASVSINAQTDAPSSDTAAQECTTEPQDSAVQEVSHETFVEKEQVYLEDNRIDQEIKQAEQKEAQKQISRPVNKYANCQLPPISLLKIPPAKISDAEVQSELSHRSAQLLKTLDEFGVKASITDVVQGPAVSRFELKPAPGVKVKQITSLTDDIALSLAAQSIAIEAPIPGKSALGVIIPNPKPTPVYFYDLVKDENFIKSPNLLQVVIGVTINGSNIYSNLAEMPHLLIAGSTGSGKSVCVNSIIASILFRARADQVKFIMIDPKMVELSGYNGIPHLIAPVVTDPAKASGALMWAVEEMERRYELLSKCQGIKNIGTYNEKLEQLREEVDPALEPMPYIVIVIDELADLMMTCSAEVEGSICRLTQMARAVGMHLIIATQRPSVNVITGLIKANLPSRIAFSVSSQVDSKTILDAAGAEKLLGKGDMLFLPKGLSKPKRLQGPYVSDNELNDLISFVKSQGKPEYLDIAIARSKDGDDEDDDDDEEDSDLSLTDQIKKYLENQEKTSTSMLQRKFRIGYNRAARIMDQLEEEGVVSPSDGSKQRRVLIGRSSAQV